MRAYGWVFRRRDSVLAGHDFESGVTSSHVLRIAHAIGQRRGSFCLLLFNISSF